MKHNCLTRALDQWNEDRSAYRIWYNSNHVIALEIEATFVAGYLPLKDFGYEHFVGSFELTYDYRVVLESYLAFEEAL